MTIWEYDTCHTVELHTILKNNSLLLKQYETHEIAVIVLNAFICYSNNVQLYNKWIKHGFYEKF